MLNTDVKLATQYLYSQFRVHSQLTRAANQEVSPCEHRPSSPVGLVGSIGVPQAPGAPSGATKKFRQENKKPTSEKQATKCINRS